MKVPEWFSLVFKTKDDNYDAIRWSLFEWIFKFGTKYNNSLQKVHTANLTIVLITLKYLLQVKFIEWCLWIRSVKPISHFEQQGEMTVDEADAILIAENYTRNIYKNRIPRIGFPNKLNTHIIRIAHLYTKVYGFIRQCMEICGLFYYTVSSWLNSMASVFDWFILFLYFIFSPKITLCSMADISIKYMKKSAQTQSRRRKHYEPYRKIAFTCNRAVLILLLFR